MRIVFINCRFARIGGACSSTGDDVDEEDDDDVCHGLHGSEAERAGAFQSHIYRLSQMCVQYVCVCEVFWMGAGMFIIRDIK